MTVVNKFLNGQKMRDGPMPGQDRRSVFWYFMIRLVGRIVCLQSDKQITESREKILNQLNKTHDDVNTMSTEEFDYPLSSKSLHQYMQVTLLK